MQSWRSERSSTSSRLRSSTVTHAFSRGDSLLCIIESGRFLKIKLDPYSSAVTFAGWRQGPFRIPADYEPLAVAAARTAGLAIGRVTLTPVRSRDLSTLVFDLDGTLSDPLEGIARSYNHALTAHGFEERSNAELARLVGPPLDQGLLELGVPRDRIVAVAQLATAGIRMGVCTSKRSDFATRILAMFGLRELFSFVSGGDIGVTKAQQLQALVAAGTIDPGAIMIGDRAVDVHAAKANGLVSCGVLWGFGSREELADAQPEYLIAKPVELLRFAASISGAN